MGGQAARSGQCQGHSERLIEGAHPRRCQAPDEIGEHRLGQADEGVAVDARFVLESILHAEFDLRRQSVATRVDRSADDGRESRIDQSLSADDREDARSSRIGCARATDAEEIAPPQTSA